MEVYTVALAETLPKLEIPVAGGKITFLPACMANSSGSATAATTGWRVCSLTDMRFLSYGMVNGAPAGSIEVSWEDSTWGNDYDMDGVAELDFCVGAACDPALGVASNQLRIRAQATYAAAGHALRFGYTVTGSSADGTHLDILRPGGQNFTSLPAPATVTPPTARTFSVGASAAKLLESPLLYAAKYGKANSDLTGGGANKDQPDGIPDNYFKVTNPAGLFDALGKVFEEAAVADASAAAIASNSTRLNTDTHVYQALFHSPAWTGDLKAMPLSSTGTVGTASWSASANIPAAASRNIKTWNGTTWNDANGSGLDFNWSNPVLSSEVTAAQQTAIGSADILNYIRGDQSKEKNQTNGIYRARSSRMGDIVNSDPHYVAAENYGYDQPGSGLLAAQKTEYTTFRTGIKTTRKKMLYVGVNDGMLHAINAANTAVDGGGDEIFAYVPNAVIPNLSALAQPNYQHRFYVDGSPNSGDAYLGGWKTVLLGTLGAGGKGVFALDITNPDNFDASKVIWEFTDATDLGMIMSRAHVARMNNGHWYAIFGNGYNSSLGKAKLFLVPLDKSQNLPVIKIDTGVGTDNGMSEPALLDTNGDRIVDVIYAGDLRGNVWKFDMSSTTASNWEVAYQSGNGNNAVPAPLFKAQIISGSPSVAVEQPITGALEIGAAPGGVSGYMVYFGTGSYLGNTDVGVTATQTAYGILDAGNKIAPGNTGRDSLQPQTFVYEGARTSTDSSLVRVASNNAVAYTGGSAKRGWYLDLLSAAAPASPVSPANLGERIVAVPLLRHGRVILTSIVPSSAVCAQGGYSWITELDALSGGRLSYSVFDPNNDGLYNAADNAVYGPNGATSNPASSIKLGDEGLMKAPTVISAGEKEYKVGSGTAGSVVVINEKGTNGKPRSSWRQIFPK
ncbi:pilus assembly protein [Noviherbaspirillum sedimenti]|uniref:pilus assembly protein n=1 Tax=Noviherbaspirillum sedimenti TaxID=2320865 RepID=UPI0018F6D428|nr:PilC/PilY family type IV pilus protein [Noviherbaspirillum sedimenti]